MKTSQLSLSVFLAVLSAIRLFADPPVVQPTAPKFLIGVWYQPVENFQKWKDRGINTLVGYASTVPRDQWTDAARKAGLFYIAKPTGDPGDMKADLADPNFLAWEQPDEPDGGGATPPDKIVENYKAWKAAGDKPVLLNLDGWRTQYGAAADYIKYCEGADWIAFDYYIINRGEGPENIKKIGERIDRIKEWTDGKKKIFVFIECSDQNLKVSDWGKQIDPDGTKMRCPTAVEMKRQIDMAVAHGASGIIYFPDIIGRNWEAFDGTPDDCDAAMKTINAKLTAAADKAAPADAPKPVPPVSPAPSTRSEAAFDGKQVTIDGVRYKLVADQ